MTMPKGYDPNNENWTQDIEVVDEEIEQMKQDASKWLDYYDIKKLAQEEGYGNNNTPPPSPKKLEIAVAEKPTTLKMLLEHEKNENRSKNKEEEREDTLTALGITAIIATAACFIIGLINLNYWYLMIPGFIGLFLIFALSGGSGNGHAGYEAAHYWRSSRGRTFRMWAVNRRGG